jgi:hypothetical protein
MGHVGGRRVEATIAKWPGNFVCHRAIGENLDAFGARADAECRAAKLHSPVILFFMKEEEPSDAARS